MNSLFDPNRTGTGHQPIGFDQWMAFYNRYRVTGIDVRLDVQNTGASMLKGALVANNSTSAFTDDTAFEEDFSRRYAIGASTGEDQATVTASFDLAKVTGRRSREYDADDSYAGTLSTSPTELLILHVVNLANTGNLTSNFTINITFHTVMYDRNTLSQS
jgi:hypothetical protein